MIPCKKILAAVDFSHASFEALKAANELASCFSAELLLVHVRHPDPWPADLLAAPGFDRVESERQLQRDAMERLEEVAETRVAEGVERRVILKKGDPGHEILQTAETEGVDLIVIATHGMSAWHHYIHGAVAQRVIHHTPCAVLVVRSALRGEGKGKGKGKYPGARSQEPEGGGE